MGTGSLQYIPVVVFPPLSVCWYAPLVSQLCSCHSSKGPMKGAPYLLTPPPVTFSVPSQPRQHGWPLSPCHYPGVMWPVTEVHASSSAAACPVVRAWTGRSGVILSGCVVQVRIQARGQCDVALIHQVDSFKGAVHSNMRKLIVTLMLMVSVPHYRWGRDIFVVVLKLRKWISV